jgi:hypothetical protein
MPHAGEALAGKILHVGWQVFAVEPTRLGKLLPTNDTIVASAGYVPSAIFALV